MKSKVSNWTGMFEVYFLGLPYALFSTNGLENSRKILAVIKYATYTVAKRKPKNFSGFLFATA